MHMAKRLTAEFIGTLWLVLGGASPALHWPAWCIAGWAVMTPRSHL